MQDRSHLALTSTAAAVLLVTLCAMTLTFGVSQQTFEWAAAPDAYAAALASGAAPLRWLVLVDDLFIPAYVAAGVLLAEWLWRQRRGALPVLVGLASIAAGVLDLAENHHLLAMLRLAEQGVSIPATEILRRSELSQLKWLLGHVGFALAGLSMEAKGPLARVVRGSLVLFQLPLGAAVWIASGPLLTVLVWMRYGALVSGFFLLPRLASAHGTVSATAASAAAGVEGATGARA